MARVIGGKSDFDLFFTFDKHLPSNRVHMTLDEQITMVTHTSNTSEMFGLGCGIHNLSVSQNSVKGCRGGHLGNCDSGVIPDTSTFLVLIRFPPCLRSVYIFS